MIKLKHLNPRLAEIGKIKIGGKGKELISKKGNKYHQPIKYDHFVITTTERDKKTGQFIPDVELMKKLSDDMKPKEIPIRLVFDDIDMNFYTSYSSYQGKKLFCSGDGETAMRRENNPTSPNVKYREKPISCDPETCKIFEEDKCKVSGILSCMITVNPEFGGVYRFRTHSWNSVSNIIASLQFISDETNGILKGIPLKLKMLKKTTEEHGDVNIVTIVLDGIELAEMRKAALMEWSGRQQLGIEMKEIENKARNSGFLNSIDTQEDIQEEYYPETLPVDNITDKIKEAGIVNATVKIIPEEKKIADPEELKDAIENKEIAEEQEPENKNQSELDIF